MCSNSLPADFIPLVAPVLGADLDRFVGALSDSPVTSIRLNTKTGNLDVLSLAAAAVPWCETGRYLTERPRFTSDPLFHAGAYYVQEASSMFLYQALRQCVDPRSVVLDFCAAPGGKSTLISSFLDSEALLVANEYVPQRAHILVENLAKWGAANCVVTNNDTSHFAYLGEVFDAVCVDAPCSGEGMFRKEPKAIADWSVANVEKCVARQREILRNAWQVLRPGGVLIYSTCTYNTLENEGNIQWLVEEYGAEYQSLTVNPEWNILVTGHGYRFMPHRTKGEGLFLAVVRKPFADTAAPNFKLPKHMPPKADDTLQWLTSPSDFSSVVCSDAVYALPKAHLPMILRMKERLNVVSMGVNTALVKGKDLIPQQSLALSLSLNRNQFAEVEVESATALSYLKTETIQLPDAPRGFLLLTYKGIPLGWVKNVGNRCNNLYPSAWRIRF